MVLLWEGLSWFPAETFGNGSTFFPVDTAFKKAGTLGQEGAGQRGSWKGRRERQVPFVQMSVEHLAPVGAKSAAAESDRNL